MIFICRSLGGAMVAAFTLAAAGCVSPHGMDDMHGMHHNKGMMGQNCPRADGNSHDMSSHDMGGMKDGNGDTRHDAHASEGGPKCPHPASMDHHPDGAPPQH